MSRLCLDTSAYSHFSRGDPRAVHAIDAADWIGVPVVVLAELWAGFSLGGQRDRNQEGLQKFLAHAAVEVLAVDEHVARIYAEIAVELRRAGTPAPSNDIWIAACAARHGAWVLTYDDHFRLMPRVGTQIIDGSG